MLVSILMAATLGASAAPVKLGVEERRYFGTQLQRLVVSLQKDLETRKIHCEPTSMPALAAPIVPGDVSTWVGAEAREMDGSYEPMQWQVMLACRAPDGHDFRMGAALAARPMVVPRAQVKKEGEGFVIRDIGGNTQLLIAGPVQIFEKTLPKPPSPDAAPPVLAVAKVAMVAAEEGPGTPRALDVLSAIGPDALRGALAGAAAVTAPQTALAAHREPPSAASSLPEEVPYAASDAPEPRPVALVLPEKGARIGRLERALTTDEKAYFATLRARAVRAALAAIQPAISGCTYSRGTPGDERERGELGPDGVAPRSLEFTISCPGTGTPPQTAFVVKLSRYARVRPNVAPDDLRTLADDAFIERMGSLPTVKMLSLQVGQRAPGVEKKLRVTPGVMRLGAVEITLMGSSAQEKSLSDLLAKVDLAPLRALVKNPPRLPAGQARAVEGRPSTTPRKQVEAEVYKAVLDEHAGRSMPERMVVDADLSTDSLGPAFAALASAAMPELLASAFADFDKVAAQSGPFPSDLVWRVPLVRLSRSEREEIFPRQRTRDHDGWKIFRERYPNARGILSVSRVGLSKDASQAVVAVSWQADWLAGAGEIWFLRKTEHGWAVTCRMQRWVS